MNASRCIYLLIAFGGVTSLVACASTMKPQELVDARNAYNNAAQGPASRLDPADLRSAKEHLDVAEAEFAKDGDLQSARDHAYISTRKSELAGSVARTVETTRNTESVVNAMHANQTKAVARTSAALGRANSQLNSQGAELKLEQERLANSKERTAQAMADLAKLGTVKQESRGTVLTLSGGVLFASAKSELLPSAQAKLNEVASALTQEDPLSNMVVEGHTDSRGGASYNQNLSQRRAQTVRDYLVMRGVAADRITAQGFGETRAIADNGSPEGRANNRRVEIVILPTLARQ